MARISPRLLAKFDAERHASRLVLATHMVRLKNDYVPQRIAERMAKRKTGDLAFRAREVVVQMTEIAADNRGIFAGLSAALLLWVMGRYTLRSRSATSNINRCSLFRFLGFDKPDVDIATIDDEVDPR